MRIALAFLLAFAVGALAKGRWDMAFRRVGAITAASGSAQLQVRDTPDPLDVTPPYMRARCAADARLVCGFADAGCAVQSDGGQPCGIVRFSLGETFYCQFARAMTHVAAIAADAGALSCDIDQGQPE